MRIQAQNFHNAEVDVDLHGGATRTEPLTHQLFIQELDFSHSELDTDHRCKCGITARDAAYGDYSNLKQALGTFQGLLICLYLEQCWLRTAARLSQELGSGILKAPLKKR
jgi:hypothetical protein